MTIQSTAVFPKTATTIIRAKRASHKWPTAEDILSPEMTFGLLLKWQSGWCWNDIWIDAEMTKLGLADMTNQVVAESRTFYIPLLFSPPARCPGGGHGISAVTIWGFSILTVFDQTPQQKIFNFQFWHCRIKLRCQGLEKPAKEIQCFIRFAFRMCLHLGSLNIWFHTPQNYIYKRNRETLSSTTLTNLLVENIELCEVWEGGREESRVVAGRCRVDQHWTDHLTLHSANCSVLVNHIGCICLTFLHCVFSSRWVDQHWTNHLALHSATTMQILDYKIFIRMNWNFFCCFLFPQIM